MITAQLKPIQQGIRSGDDLPAVVKDLLIFERITWDDFSIVWTQLLNLDRKYDELFAGDLSGTLNGLWLKRGNIHTSAMPDMNGLNADHDKRYMTRAELAGMGIGVLDPGSVVFIAAPHVFAQDNANFYYDNATNQLEMGDGAVGTPSYSFRTDTDTGFYLVAGATIGVAIAGALDFEFSTNEFFVHSGSHIEVADDVWIGLGAATGRIVFDSDPAPDVIGLMTCYVGVGILTPESIVHIYEGDAGGGIAPVALTKLTIEDDDSAYIQFLTRALDSAGIYFGDSAANNPAAITYNHPNDRFLFRVGSTDMAWLTTTGLGIGINAPVSLAEIYSSTAHPVLTITGAHATDYDPQLQFRTDAVPTVKWSMGVDSIKGADNDLFTLTPATSIDVAVTATTFFMATTGNIGIGYTPVVGIGINQYNASSSNTLDCIGYRALSVWTPTVNNVKVLRGADYTARLDGTANVGEVTGALFFAYLNQGSGTITTIHGANFNFQVDTDCSRAATTFYGIRFNSTHVGAGTLPTASTGYQLYLDDYTTDITVTTKYGIVQSGTSMVNCLLNKTTIGLISTVSQGGTMLDVYDAANTAGAINEVSITGGSYAVGSGCGILFRHNYTYTGYSYGAIYGVIHSVATWAAGLDFYVNTGAAKTTQTKAWVMYGTGGHLNGQLDNQFIKLGAGQDCGIRWSNITTWAGAAAGTQENMQFWCQGVTATGDFQFCDGSVLVGGSGGDNPPTKLSVKASATGTAGGYSLISSDDANVCAYLYEIADDAGALSLLSGGVTTVWFRGDGVINSIMTHQCGQVGFSNMLCIGDDGTDVLVGVANSGTNMYLLARAAGVYSRAFAVYSTGQCHVVDDNRYLYFGASLDFRITYNGTEGVIDSAAVAPSDINVTCGANKTIELQNDVYDDVRINTGSFDRPGTSDPAIVSYTPTGSTIATYLYEFNKNNIASFTVQIPHTYKEGSDIKVHLHWTPGLRGNEENGNTVGWKVDYTWANIDGTFGAMGTADLSDTCDGTDDKHQMTPEVTIDGHTAAKNISSMLICNVKRTDTGADDTWATNTSGNLPLLLEIDFHIPVNTMGSRNWTAK